MHFFGVNGKMKFITKDSKKGKLLIHKFVNAYAHSLRLPALDRCYRKYSFSKLSAYNTCYNIVNGYVDMCNRAASGENKMVRQIVDYGVLSFNSRVFTFGAVINRHSENFDLEKNEYIVITKTNVSIIC